VAPKQLSKQSKDQLFWHLVEHAKCLTSAGSSAGPPARSLPAVPADAFSAPPPVCSSIAPFSAERASLCPSLATAAPPTPHLTTMQAGPSPLPAYAQTHCQPGLRLAAWPAADCSTLHAACLASALLPGPLYSSRRAFHLQQCLSPFVN
jgi:hypothetical protein